MLIDSDTEKEKNDNFIVEDKVKIKADKDLNIVNS